MAQILWIIFLTSLIFANGTFSITENEPYEDGDSILDYMISRLDKEGFVGQIRKDEKEKEKQKEKEDEAGKDEWVHIDMDINKKEKCRQMLEEIKMYCGIDTNNVARNRRAQPPREMWFATEAESITDATNIATEPETVTTETFTTETVTTETSTNFTKINEKDNNCFNNTCTGVMPAASVLFLIIFGCFTLVVLASCINIIAGMNFLMLPFQRPLPLPRIFNRNIITNLNGDETGWDEDFRL